MATKDSEWETVVAGSEKQEDDGWETVVASEASAGLSQETAPEQTYTGAVKEGLYRGATNVPAMLGAGSMQQQGTFAGAFPTQPELETSVSGIQQGVMGAKPPSGTPGQRIVGAAAEAISDPASYIGGGLRSIGRIGIGGAGAETGGMLGAETQKAITGEEGVTGRLLGSLAGGIGASSVTAPTRAVVGGATDVAGQIYNKYKQVKVDPAAAEDAVAAGSAKRLLEHAVKAQGADNLEAIVGDINKASQYLIGADAPLLISMADNPVMREQIIRLAKTDPDTRARIQQELTNISKKIDEKANSIFGDRYVAVNDKGLNISNITKRIDAIDTKLGKLTDPLSEQAGRADTGAAIENLVAAKKAIAKKEQGVRYDQLKIDARKEGIKMDAAASEELYKFFTMNRIRDIFGRGTETERKVLSILGPKTALPSGMDANVAALERAAGNVPETATTFRNMSFDDVDSLKRLINEQQRKIKDPAQLNTLNQFEDVFNNVRSKFLPGKYDDALKSIDADYYKKVGVPFGAQGVKDIDSAKYASTVAPIIVKNRDSLRQFIGAVGEEGRQVANNAILSKAYEQTVKDGVFSPAALSSFIKKNDEVLKDLPEARKLLTDSVMDNNILRAERAKLDVAAKEAQKRIANNYLTQADVPDYATMLNNVMSNAQGRAKVLKDISDLSPEASAAVRGSLRAELADKVLKSGQGLNYLYDPKNKAGIDAIMGSGYLNNLKMLATMADTINKLDVNKFSMEIAKSQVDAIGKIVPGLDIPYVTSTVRDRISSATQKAVRLISRANTARMQTKFDDQVRDLIFDPEGVKKLAKTSHDLNFTIKNPYQFNKFMESFTDSIPSTLYISLQSGE